MDAPDEAALKTLLYTPRSQLKPAQVQRVAKSIVSTLAKGTITNMPERDSKFIKSLSEAKRLSDKQIDYIIGDDEGDSPSGGPALRKRFLMALEEQAKNDAAFATGAIGVAAGAKQAKPGPSSSGPQTIDEELYLIEKNLDETWAELKGDMEEFLKFPGVAQQRDRYLRLTDPAGYVPTPDDAPAPPPDPYTSTYPNSINSTGKELEPLDAAALPNGKLRAISSSDSVNGMRTTIFEDEDGNRFMNRQTMYQREQSAELMRPPTGDLSVETKTKNSDGDESVVYIDEKGLRFIGSSDLERVARLRQVGISRSEIARDGLTPAERNPFKR